jgi:dTDP-4-amino-4,6-dideoxygalactose transaminase
MEKQIPFNKPYLTGKEAHYLYQAVYSGKISGNGMFTKKCQEFFEKNYQIEKALLTSSCTDALEMSGILMNLQPGDEVIMPSFTFVSTSNAFILRGAVIRFADSYPDNPNMDPSTIEALINEKTKAIVVVHYAGIACDMDPILDIAKRHNLFVVEDAAQAVDSYYKDRPLGSIGHFATFSFHETKNIMSGEGGLLAVNDSNYAKRAEIIWEKGTNRAAFFRGEVDKYGWVDIGSSFLPSEIVAAFLWAQLENLEDIQQRRKSHWNQYYNSLKKLETSGKVKLPIVPEYATNNAHMFFIVCKSLEERSALIDYLRAKNIYAVFHYISLHKSPFYQEKHDGRELANCDHFSDCLLRLPLFYELTTEDIDRITQAINHFYAK